MWDLVFRFPNPFWGFYSPSINRRGQILDAHCGEKLSVWSRLASSRVVWQGNVCKLVQKNPKLFTRSKEVYIQYKHGDTPRKVSKILGFGGPDTLASCRRVVGFFRLKYIGFKREVHRCLPKPTFFRFVFFQGLSCQRHGLLLPGAGGS